MALTVNNFSGAESGGLGETSAVSGSPAAVTTASRLRTGAYIYRAVGSDWFEFDPLLNNTDAGDKYLCNFSAEFNALASTANTFFEAYDSTGLCFDLRVNTSQKVEAYDANGTIIGTSSATLADDTTYFMEVIFDHLNSGTFDLYVDTTSEITASAKDLSAGGASLTAYRFYGHSTNDANWYDDIYMASGAVVADRLTNVAAAPYCEVFGYRHSVTGTSPDAGGLGNTGTALNAGNWQNTVDDNTSTDGEYTASGVYGSVDMDGPNGDANIDGDSNIKAIKGLANMNRDGGGGTTHYLFLGDSGDGNSPQAFDDNTHWGPITTSDAYYSVVTETVPTSSQDIRMGFGTGGAQDIHMNEMWSFLLHVPSGGPITVTGSGTPQADDSVGEGVAEIIKTGSGTPQADNATGSGIAAIVFTSSGSSQADDAIGSGAGSRVVAGSGTPQADDSLGSGSGTRILTGSGTPQASNALGDGEGTAIGTVDGSGTPQADDATGLGSGERVITGTGTPQADDAIGSGVAAIVFSGSGTPQAGDVTGSGSGIRTITGAGTTQADDATGSGAAIRIITGSGIPQSDDAQGSGSGKTGLTGSGTPQADNAVGTGSGLRIITGSGISQSDDALSDGSGNVSGPAITGSGTPQADDVTGLGIGERTVKSSGTPQSNDAVGVGVGSRVITGAGSPKSDDAIGSGIGFRIIVGLGTPQADNAIGFGEGFIPGAGDAFGRTFLVDARAAIPNPLKSSASNPSKVAISKPVKVSSPIPQKSSIPKVMP